MNQCLKGILLIGTIGVISGGLGGCSSKTAAVDNTVAAETNVMGADGQIPSTVEGQDQTVESDAVTGEMILSGEGAQESTPDGNIQEDGVAEDGGAVEYPEFLEATVGLFNYYNQNDPRWADKFYGNDPIDTYGCGPTVLAMVVSYFTGNKIAPDEMAAWAAESGFCQPGQGSTHDIIPNGLRAYGLIVEGMEDRSPEAVYQALLEGNILVALVDKGYFTDKGHFLILIKANSNNTIRLADPANADNNDKDWKPEFIIEQLKEKAAAGGPLWKISYGN